MDGEERGRPRREREDEEAYLHGDGGDCEKAIDDGGVTVDGGVEGGVHGERRSRDGDAAVDDVVDPFGAVWVERDKMLERAGVAGRQRDLVELRFVPGERAAKRWRERREEYMSMAWESGVSEL